MASHSLKILTSLAVWSSMFLSVVNAFPSNPLAHLFARQTTSAVNTTTCNNQTYTYLSLAGYGFTSPDARDKFNDTAGGLGSSAAIDADSWTLLLDPATSVPYYTGLLYALPDRGWNTEGTLNFQPRIHKFNITFRPNAEANASSPSLPNLQLTYWDTIRFTDPAGNPVTGLDPDFTGPYLNFTGFPSLPSATYTGDGFGANGTGGRRVSVDTEGLVLGANGTFWVSDEYGAFIYHFNATGHMVLAIESPDAVTPRRNGTISYSADSPPRYDPDRAVNPSRPQSGRSNNQGLEGLTASPDKQLLYTLLQSALAQEGGAGNSSTRRYARLLEYNVTNPSSPNYTAEYIVPLPLFLDEDGDETVAAQSEIHYISSTQFMVLSRDSGRGAGQDDDTESLYRHVDIFDISNATNLLTHTDDPGADCANCSIATRSGGVLNSTITPASYCSWLDFNVNTQLNRFGLHNGGEQDDALLNEKWESLALVPVCPVTNAAFGRVGCPADSEGRYFLFSLSDNDFITQNGSMDSGRLLYSDESGYSLINQVLVFEVQLPTGVEPLLG